MTLEALVKKFLIEERLSIKNILIYGGLGLSTSSGHVNDVVTDVALSGHLYTPERQDQVAESIGEMMFYLHVIATTTGKSMDMITREYVNMYLKKKNKEMGEHVSLLELMKHVKADSKTKKTGELKRDYLK